MAVSFVGIGAYATKTGSTGTSVSVPLPTGVTTSDLLVMRVGGTTLSSNAVTYSAPVGWETSGLISYNDPYVSGTRIEMSWFWKAAEASETAPTVTLSAAPGSGASVGAVMYAFRGGTLAMTPVAALGSTGTTFTAQQLNGVVDGYAFVDAHKRGTAGVVSVDQGFTTPESSALSWGTPDAGAIQGGVFVKPLTTTGVVTFPTLTTGTSGAWPYLQAIVSPTGAGWSVGRLAY